MNKEYQMVTVYDYLKMLDKDVKYVNNDAKTIKENVEKYLINMRRAQTNAKLLEVLLA
ncbi:unknown [Clostridium sp. CAG:813]|nr:unknown [Clostridium sp. CAG:813]